MSCEHGKRKYLCVDCGGKGLCIHGKNRYFCLPCGGKNFCEHKITKTRCIDCNGKEMCKHGKRKVLCKECDGSLLCEHDKNKYFCSECCNSNYFCEHKIRKSRCRECGGKDICKHSKRKSQCIECGGSEICEHKINKYTCHECKGSQICIHEKRKYACVDCNGSAICEHNISKYWCKECEGSVYCKHNKIKYFCKECDGRDLCKAPLCEIRPNNKLYDGYCRNCCLHYRPDIQVCRNYKTKEKSVTDFVLEQYPDFTWIHDKKIPDGCSKRRPDLLLDLGEQVIVIEIDENQHDNYDCSCENKRLMEISQDIGHRPLVFLRFNPDDYIDDKGRNMKSCWKVGKDGILRIEKETEWSFRLKLLKEQIQYWIDNKTDKTVEVIELFYDCNQDIEN
jgi:hypothetical protein